MKTRLDKSALSWMMMLKNLIDRILAAVNELRHEANVREEILDNIAAMLNCFDPSQLVGTVRTSLGKSAQVNELESEVSTFQAECE